MKKNFKSENSKGKHAKKKKDTAEQKHAFSILYSEKSG